MDRRIAVLMTCFNRVQTTLECLKRLFAQEVPEGYAFDVWLVDDASPDKTGEKVKATYPQVNVIQGTGTLFWCRGMRLAWDKAAEAYDYDFYLWLNDDTMLNAGALTCVLKDYETVATPEQPARTIVGSFTTSPTSDFISYGTENKGAGRVVPNGKPQEATGMLAGNFVLVHKTVYQIIGPICGKFYHGYGDYDYAYLMHENKVPFYCASKVLGWCSANHGAFALEGKNLWQRLQLLSKPNGLCLHDAVLLKLRHGGLHKTLLTFLHVIWIAISGRRA